MTRCLSGFVTDNLAPETMSVLGKKREGSFHMLILTEVKSASFYLLTFLREIGHRIKGMLSSSVLVKSLPHVVQSVSCKGST